MNKLHADIKTWLNLASNNKWSSSQNLKKQNLNSVQKKHQTINTRFKVWSGCPVECLDVSLLHPADYIHWFVTPRLMWTVYVIVVGYKNPPTVSGSPSSHQLGYVKCFTVLFWRTQKTGCLQYLVEVPLPSFSDVFFWDGNVLYSWGSVSNDHSSKAQYCTLVCVCVLCGLHMGTCIHGEVKSVNKVDSLHWCQPTRHHHDN